MTRKDIQTTSPADQSDPSVEEMARDTASAVKERGETLRDKAKDAARDGIDRGKAELQSRADAARQSAADETAETGEAMRDAAGHFDPGDYRRRTAMHMADTLDGVAASLRETDLNDLRSDVESFARRNPVLFYAGAALTGFALSRLVKATARDTGAGQTRGQDEAAYPDPDGIVDYPATAEPVRPVATGTSLGNRQVHDDEVRK